MIPSFNHSGVLPPFQPDLGPTSSASMAPYQTTMLDIAKTFCSSSERARILSGLIAYRQSLRNAGIMQGFQWIAGSFLEDCENQRQRPPKDIDVVTFARRPIHVQAQQEWAEFYGSNPQLFDQVATQDLHKCDAYYVDLYLPPEFIVSRSRFWFGLFSHQRDTYVWKGILELPLSSNDDNAKQFIGGLYAP